MLAATQSLSLQCQLCRTSDCACNLSLGFLVVISDNSQPERRTWEQCEYFFLETGGLPCVRTNYPHLNVTDLKMCAHLGQDHLYSWLPVVAVDPQCDPWTHRRDAQWCIFCMNWDFNSAMVLVSGFVFSTLPVGVMPAHLFRCFDAFPGISSFYCLASVSKLYQPYQDMQGVLAKEWANSFERTQC